MPASRIGEEPLVVAKFDVVGFDSAGHTAFVAHVGLASKAFSGASPVRVNLSHMIPPFMADVSPYSSADCYGSAELSDDEYLMIGVFIRELKSEYAAEAARRKATGNWDAAAKNKFRADQYAIRPAVIGPSSDRNYHQLSCVGFVQEAYANADIVLLVEDEAKWPRVDLSTLKKAYPSAVTYLDDSEFRKRKGIGEGDSWPVLLPGYILNSLARTRTEIKSSPYRPACGDEVFCPDSSE